MTYKKQLDFVVFLLKSRKRKNADGKGSSKFDFTSLLGLTKKQLPKDLDSYFKKAKSWV